VLWEKCRGVACGDEQTCVVDDDGNPKCVGVLIAPTLHRWLHIFHIESVEEEEARRTKKPH